MTRKANNKNNNNQSNSNAKKVDREEDDDGFDLGGESGVAFDDDFDYD